MTKDYYATLGVPRAADEATIHSAFRARARQYHPDAGAGSSAPKFSEALEAYHTLSDPQLRRQHDIDLGTPTRQSNVIPEPLFAPERSWPDYRHSGAYQFDIVGELFELIESELDFPIRVSRMFF
jgi:curved DNA-binding protein CbpA